jgi:hypothetical protein
MSISANPFLAFQPFVWSLASAFALLAPLPSLAADNEPWANDPAVQEVLALRRQGIAAMTSTGANAATQRLSSTFVANTPANAVLTGEQMLEAFERGAVSYVSVEQHLDYAGSHGPDIVVLMGEEIVVPGPSAPNAGKRVHRRFTDVFRKENGEWRHDLRHANVTLIE